MDSFSRVFVSYHQFQVVAGAEADDPLDIYTVGDNLLHVTGRSRLTVLTGLHTGWAEVCMATLPAPPDASIDGWDAAGLKAIASAIIASGPEALALAGSDTPTLVVTGRSALVNPALGIPAAGDLVKALTARFGGKGGGTRELAQAGGLAGEPRDVIAAAEELLTPTV